jgi:predicted dehydrogenase
MPLRVGLVGCGYWGTNLLRDLGAAGCAAFVADPRLEAAPAGAAGLARDLAELDPDLDGYVVATPSTTHAAVVTELLSRGRPIFCEKPLTTDVASAQALARAGRGQVFVMHKWAYHGGVQALAALARSEELGALKGVFTRRLQWGKPAAAADPVWELTIHDLTIVRAIVGALPRLETARAVATPRGLEGVTAILGTAPFAHIEVSAVWPGAERKVRVYFEGGMALLDDPLADHIEIIRGLPPAGERRAPTDVERRAIDTEWPSAKQIRIFAEHLRGGPPPPTGVDEGLEIVTALAAIRAAALDSLR